MLYETFFGANRTDDRSDFFAGLRQDGEETPWEKEMRRRREQLEAYNRQAEESRRLMWLRENSMQIFLEQEDDICFDLEGCISSQALYELYKNWCRQRQVLERTPRSFSLFLRKNAAKYNLVYSMNIPGPQGGHLRGYRGIREKEHPFPLPHTDDTDNTNEA